MPSPPSNPLPSSPPGEGTTAQPAELQLAIGPHCEAPERLQAYFQALESARGSHQLIVIKGHPDPDSIASALAHRYISRHFEIDSTILYFDEISHPENRALVKALEVDLRHYEDGEDLSSFDYMSFVDTPSPHLPVRLSRLPPVLVLVDHHRPVGGFEAVFVDIREDCGSTCAIFAEYLAHSPYGLSYQQKDHVKLATAMMHGIRTDTDNMLLAWPIDFRAGAYLRPFLDTELLWLISKQSMSARTMEIIQKGLNNKQIKGTFLVAGVGFVREEDRDAIAQTADFLMRYEGIETALVFGIVNGEVVDGSLRTVSATVDPDGWLKALFGLDSAGRPYGGGRRNKGGFRIPLGLVARTRDRDALWAIGKKTIEDLIFEKIGIEKADEGDAH